MEEVVEGYGFRVVARREFFRPVFDGETLVTPWTMLELDAIHGLFGDSISGILLAPVIKASRRAWEVIEAYRSRVLYEESLWLRGVLGGIAKVAIIKPELYPLLRMRRLAHIYCSVYSRALRELGFKALSYARLTPRRSHRRLHVSLPLRPEVLKKSKCCEGEFDLPVSPWNLVRVPEGFVNIGVSSYEDIAEVHVGKPVTCSRVSMLHSILECRGPRGVVVVKDYKLSSLKWIPAFLASAPTSRFQRDPRDRAATELYYSILLRGIVRTPRIISLNVGKGRVVAVREYVDGEPVLGMKDPSAWRDVGRILARIHESGYSLGDANPSNFIKSANDIYLVDLEQARRANLERIAWDIVTVIAYSHLMNVNPLLVRELLEEYASHIGVLRIKLLRELLKVKYWTPYALMPFKLPEALTLARSTLA